MTAAGRLIVLTLVFVMLAALAEGQERRNRGPRRPRRDATSQPATASAATSTGESASTSGASSSAEAEEKKDKYLAVVNGIVHTITGPVLGGATLLSRNGRIVEIGADVAIPPDAQIIDAAGKHVYPGLIVASPSGSIFGGDPPEDSTDVFGLNMTIALAGGITTALSGNAAVKLTFGTTEEMVISREVYLPLNYSTRQPQARYELRQDLEKVRGYLRDLRRHEIVAQTDKEAKPPDASWLKGKYEKYQKLLKRELIGVASASTAHELLDWCELAREFNFRLVLRGAYEGWTVAPELSRAGVGVVISPRTTVPVDERLNRPNGATIENAKILHDHGVTVAVVPESVVVTTWGVGGRDLLNLNLEAGFAVRGGLSNDDAIRTLTIDAARVLGLDDRVGSLEVGKDADFIVCDGDVLHYMTQVHYAVVNGRVAYEKAKESLFAHIRPTGKRELAPTDDYWPKRHAWPADWKPRVRRTTSAPASQAASGPQAESQPASDEAPGDAGDGSPAAAAVETP